MFDFKGYYLSELKPEKVMCAVYDPSLTCTNMILQVCIFLFTVNVIFFILLFLIIHYFCVEICKDYVLDNVTSLCVQAVLV